MRGPRVAVCVATALVLSLLLFLGSCGEGDDPGAESLTMRQLTRSVEAQSADFLERDGTALHRSLEQFLPGRITIEVAKGSTECRSGNQTASISNPNKYPFACIVEGSAEGEGLTVNITLGFVGLKLAGRCWRAANERVSVTTGAPALVSQEEAARPVNQVRACV
jgi:hypothetical protein